MARSSSLLEVQHAIYDKLLGSADIVTTHGCEIYDYVTENAPCPYIAISTPIEVNWDMFTKYGQRDTFTVHVWSTYRGSKEVKEIQQHINDVLDETALTVTGYTSVWCTNTMTTDLRDPDNVHWHGIQYFEIYVHKAR